MSSKKRQPTLAPFLNKKAQRVEMLVQTEVETATVSETVVGAITMILILFTKECLVLMINVI